MASETVETYDSSDMSLESFKWKASTTTITPGVKGSILNPDNRRFCISINAVSVGSTIYVIPEPGGVINQGFICPANGSLLLEFNKLGAVISGGWSISSSGGGIVWIYEGLTNK